MIEDTHNAATEPLHVLVTGKLYAPAKIAGSVAIVLAGAKIRAVWHVTDVAQAQQLCAEHMPRETVEVIDLASWSAAPGYIDIHIHGLGGHDITTGPQEDIAAIARELPHFGVTS